MRGPPPARPKVPSVSGIPSPFVETKEEPASEPSPSVESPADMHDKALKQAAVPQAHTLVEVKTQEEGTTTSMSHEVLREALNQRASQEAPRSGKFVHASIVAGYRAFVPNLVMPDTTLRVLTPDASEFTPVAKTIPTIVAALNEWRTYAFDKMMDILVRYNDQDTMHAIQLSTYNTTRMVIGMYGMMCQVNNVGMSHMVTSDTLLVYAAKAERAVSLDGNPHTMGQLMGCRIPYPPVKETFVSTQTGEDATVDRPFLFFGDEPLIQQTTEQGGWKICHDLIRKAGLTPYTVSAHHGMTVGELGDELAALLKGVGLGQRGTISYDQHDYPISGLCLEEGPRILSRHALVCILLSFEATLVKDGKALALPQGLLSHDLPRLAALICRCPSHCVVLNFDEVVHQFQEPLDAERYRTNTLVIRDAMDVLGVNRVDDSGTQ